jgi:hypothetical protein
MPRVHSALTAAVAFCLIGSAGVAVAQTTMSPSDQAPPADQAAPAAAPADQAPPPAASTASGTETSAVVNGQTVQVITSQPVPDTRANRAQYGQPLSRAGRRTAPAGN